MNEGIQVTEGDLMGYGEGDELGKYVRSAWIVRDGGILTASVVKSRPKFAAIIKYNQLRPF